MHINPVILLDGPEKRDTTIQLKIIGQTRIYTRVTPNSLSLRPLEWAENGMLPKSFEQVQSSGRPSPLRAFVACPGSLYYLQ